jgi:hypothetical protein
MPVTREIIIIVIIIIIIGKYLNCASVALIFKLDLI